jgi:hypothetical protein
MTFYVDLDLLRLVTTPGYTPVLASIDVHRNDLLPFRVHFVQDGQVVDPGDDVTSLYFAVKRSGSYSQNPALVSVGPFTKSGTGEECVYTAVVPFTSAALTTAFADEPATLATMAEFSWTNDDSSNWVTADAVDCSIANDVYRPTDAIVTSPSAGISVLFLPLVTGLTGGGSTKLDGVLTADTAVPQAYLISIAGAAEIWTLVAGTDAENEVGGVVRPDDYNVSTNAKVFKRIHS